MNSLWMLVKHASLAIIVISLLQCTLECASMASTLILQIMDNVRNALQISIAVQMLWKQARTVQMVTFVTVMPLISILTGCYLRSQGTTCVNQVLTVTTLKLRLLTTAQLAHTCQDMVR